MNLTYCYRLIPTSNQRRHLEELLSKSCSLYNAALEQRITVYRRSGESLSAYDQFLELKYLRADSELGFELLPTVLARWPLVQLDLAMRAFYSRLKAKKGRAGFPRFRSIKRFNTFGLTEWAGVRLENGRFCLNGLGGSKNGSGIRLNMHRPLPDKYTIRCCTVTRRGDAWTLNLSITIPQAKPIPLVEDDVSGEDWGLENTFTSDRGETIERVRVTERKEKRANRARQDLSRAKPGSRGKKRALKALGTATRRVANARNTHLHQISAAMVKACPWKCVEKLAVKNMTGSASGTVDKPGFNVAQKRGLNKSILDSAPAKLRVVWCCTVTSMQGGISVCWAYPCCGRFSCVMSGVMRRSASVRLNKREKIKRGVCTPLAACPSKFGRKAKPEHRLDEAASGL